MRRYTMTLLLLLAALLFAGTASAYTIEVTGPPSPAPGVSDMLSVDVVLDTEGEGLYGIAMYVDWDPALLSPSATLSVRNPIPGETGSSFYLYPTGDAWYIGSRNLDVVMGAVNMSIATLVFHVVADPASAVINPSFYFGAFGALIDSGGFDVKDSVGLTALHVPEPTTTMLIGLGLLGVLYAGRRR